MPWGGGMPSLYAYTIVDVLFPLALWHFWPFKVELQTLDMCNSAEVNPQNMGQPGQQGSKKCRVAERYCWLIICIYCFITVIDGYAYDIYKKGINT